MRAWSYLRGILQGDTSSLILFVLSVNPLSFLLEKHEEYKISIDEKGKNISHLFFVDNLKLYAANIAKTMLMLKTVTQYSNDVGMKFDGSECAYQVIERGKRKGQDKTLEINGPKIQEIQKGDNYRYLGKDESVGIDGH